MSSSATSALRRDELAFHASIAFGIGDDDNVSTVAVSEHDSEHAARTCALRWRLSP